MRFSRQPGASPCFTLLELLVVVAIIGVLAGLLLPALARAKAKAHSIECLSRIKQWSYAFILYAEENEGWIPRECYEPRGEVTLNNWSQIKGKTQPNSSTDSQDVWYNGLPPYLEQPPASKFYAPPDRPNFHDKRLLIHCPTASFPASAFRPNQMNPFFSMAMNSQLIQIGPTIKFTLIQNQDPVRIVLFLDNLLEGETKVHPAQENSMLGQPGAWANRFSARHSKGGNLGFADGHVAWFPGNQVVETDDKSPLRGGPILPPRDIVWEINPF